MGVVLTVLLGLVSVSALRFEQLEFLLRVSTKEDPGETPEAFEALAQDQAHIEAVVDCLKSKYAKKGKVRKTRLKPFLVMFVKKAAGGFKVNIDSKCAELATNADIDNTDYLSELKLKILVRGLWLYLAKVPSAWKVWVGKRVKKEIRVISATAWYKKKQAEKKHLDYNLDYNIVDKSQIHPNTLK